MSSSPSRAANLSRRSILGGIGGVCLAGCVADPPVPAAQRLQTIPRVQLPPPDPFFPHPDHFQKKLPPQPGDWLARFDEPHESFEQYLANRPTRRTATRNKIVFQPLGTFGRDDMKLLQTIQRYTAIFFDTDTIISKAIPLPPLGRRPRFEDGKRWVQHNAQTILDTVLAPRLPGYAVTYIGVTNEDLYPDPDWNYVFGLATLEQRVGVYSIVRFYPEFWRQAPSAETQLLGLTRSLQLLAHETGHMFSLPHCVAFECLMNGCNSLDEADRQAKTLCPECLRKLQENLGFSVLDRYDRLAAFFRKEQLTELAAWNEVRTKYLRGAA